MALELQLNACEVCDGINVIDITGAYSVSNTGGYGDPNTPEDPSGFDSYSLSIWRPGSARDGDADFTLDLLSDVPAPDGDGYYTWLVTAADMGLTEIESGPWYFEATGTLGNSVTISDAEVVFIVELQAKVDIKMKPYDPSVMCPQGCEDPLKIFNIFSILSCSRPCDGDKATRIITHLRQLLKNCC